MWMHSELHCFGNIAVLEGNFLLGVTHFPRWKAEATLGYTFWVLHVQDSYLLK